MSNVLYLELTIYCVSNAGACILYLYLHLSLYFCLYLHLYLDLDLNCKCRRRIKEGVSWKGQPAISSLSAGWANHPIVQPSKDYDPTIKWWWSNYPIVQSSKDYDPTIQSSNDPKIIAFSHLLLYVIKMSKQSIKLDNNELKIMIQPSNNQMIQWYKDYNQLMMIRRSNNPMIQKLTERIFPKWRLAEDKWIMA